MSTLKVRKYRDVVYAIYTHKGKTLKISANVKVMDRYWDLDHVKKSDPHHKVKNEAISARMSLLKTAMLKVELDGLEPTVDLVRKEYIRSYKKSDQVPEKTFIDHFYEYLDSKRSTRSKTTVSNINQTIDVLVSFQEDKGVKMSVDTLDKGIFNRLINYYLDDMDYKDSTVDKHLRVIKAFLKWAYPEFNYGFMKYKMRRDETIIHLTEEELMKLISADLSGTLERVRDLFVFGCLTGMRYSDLKNYNKSWIQEGVIQYTQKKTGGIAMPPLFNEAIRILEKYEYELPVMSNPKFNFYLKNLFRDLELNRNISIVTYAGEEKVFTNIPLSDLVTTHTARKTFITLALSKGIAIQDVMKMSGHNDYRGMRPYISISKKHIQDASKKWDI